MADLHDEEGATRRSGSEELPVHRLESLVESGASLWGSGEDDGERRTQGSGRRSRASSGDNRPNPGSEAVQPTLIGAGPVERFQGGKWRQDDEGRVGREGSTEASVDQLVGSSKGGGTSPRSSGQDGAEGPRKRRSRSPRNPSEAERGAAFYVRWVKDTSAAGPGELIKVSASKGEGPFATAPEAKAHL